MGGIGKPLKGETLMGYGENVSVSEESRLKNLYADWMKKGLELKTGAAGAKGYDLQCGRYLKLPLQEQIDQATVEALKRKDTTYWDLNPRLPIKISEKLKEENDLVADPFAEICLTCGITPAIDTILSAFVNVGDEVISMDPDFVTSYGQIRARGAKLVTPRHCFTETIGDLTEKRWRLCPEALEEAITDKTKMIVFTNPNNPIGYVYSKEELGAIAKLAVKHGVMVLENECYERMSYVAEAGEETKFTSILSMDGMKDYGILVQGLSKGYHLSGYRIGWVVANPEIVKMLAIVQMWSSFSMAPTITQYGAEAALTMPLRQEYIAEAKKIYRENIAYTCESLAVFEGRFECARPMGGPFCFADVSGSGMDDKELSAALYELGINNTAGSSWGPEKGKNHLRLALSNPPEYQRECVDALVEALKQIFVKR